MNGQIFLKIPRKAVPKGLRNTRLSQTRIQGYLFSVAPGLDKEISLKCAEMEVC